MPMWRPATCPSSVTHHDGPLQLIPASSSATPAPNLGTHLLHSTHSYSSTVANPFEARRRHVVADSPLQHPPGSRSKMSAQPVMLPQGWEARW